MKRCPVGIRKLRKLVKEMAPKGHREKALNAIDSYTKGDVSGFEDGENDIIGFLTNDCRWSNLTIIEIMPFVRRRRSYFQLEEYREEMEHKIEEMAREEVKARCDHYNKPGGGYFKMYEEVLFATDKWTKEQLKALQEEIEAKEKELKEKVDEYGYKINK